MAAQRKYPFELRRRATHLALTSGRPIKHIANDLGVHPEALRAWVRQARADNGERPELLTSDERDELKQLRRDNSELRRANEILKAASVFRQGARPSPHEVTAFIDKRRDRFGVEPICRVLEVPTSTYYARKARPPSRRTVDDAWLTERIRAVHEANYGVYGARKMWHALHREGWRSAVAAPSG